MIIDVTSTCLLNLKFTKKEVNFLNKDFAKKKSENLESTSHLWL